MTTMDDSQLGRSRVKDTAELKQFYSELADLKTGALWTVANEIEPWYPQPKAIPHQWRYSDLRPKLLEAAELVTGDDAGRRVVYLDNPGRPNTSAAVGLLYTGLQIMNPGESMSAHRHAAAALRFVMEGTGAWTIVEGDKLRVGPRDFALTPRGTWHEHGNEAEEDFVIWQDGLDIPLVNTLDANFFAVHPELHQVPGKVLNTTIMRYGAGTLKPVGYDWNHKYSPLMAFPWERTYEALTNLAKVSDGTPYDGVIMEYTNPVDGGSVMPTISANIQLLKEGQGTKAHRHTGNVIYTVAKGNGHSIINGQRFDWTENDIFVVPAWAWHEHHNGSSSEDAVLFSFNDFPVMRSLGLWVEEAYDANGGEQYLDF